MYRVPSIVGVATSYTVKYNAVCTLYLAYRGGIQLYSGVQCCMYCIPSMIGVVPSMVGVVPSYTVEYNAACTVYLAW